MNKYYTNLDKELKEYLDIIGVFPTFIYKYICDEQLLRLDGVTYFCGMDYCSKQMYDFKYYVSRLTHSISCAIMTYHFTESKPLTIKALLHDIATPSFSHVIDYMNGDFLKQESTEEKTLEIINNSNIKRLLESDNIDVNFIVNKDENIVDNTTPKLCIDRLDGLFLNSLVWAKNIDINTVRLIYNNVILSINENKELELSAKNEYIADLINYLSVNVGKLQESDNDMFCMLLLADILKYMINNKYIKLTDLYKYSEEKIIKKASEKSIDDMELAAMLLAFTNLSSVNSVMDVKVKKRYINPLVNGKRLSSINETANKRINNFINN